MGCGLVELMVAKQGLSREQLCSLTRQSEDGVFL